MDDLQVEHGFLKAPWEILVRNFRAGHKPVAKELEMLSTAVNQLIEQQRASSLSGSSRMEVDSGDSNDKRAPQRPEFAAIRNRLTGLKRKLEETRMSDEESILKCQYRIVHLHKRASGGSPPSAWLPSSSNEHLIGIDQLALDETDDNRDKKTKSLSISKPSTSNDKNNSNSSTQLLSKRRSPDHTNNSGTISAESSSASATAPATTSASTATKSDANTIAKYGDGGIAEYDIFIDGESMTSLEGTSRWEKAGLDRALVDYMLREGRYETAKQLSISTGIRDITNEEMFEESRIVLEALRRRDCKEGLKWCAENKRRLQKVNSKLEFRLRCQEFVELARARRKKDAIQYMRKYMSSNAGSSGNVNLSSSNQANIAESERFLDIQRFMALLIFHPNTTCQPYKDLYSQHKWQELETAFKVDHYRLHGLTIESSLEILLKAGLSSLKTRKCATEADRKSGCPTCTEPFVSLAQSLPRSRHENSVLVCKLTGEIMDENNPPMAMPQGHVYSRKALTKLANENDGVNIVDPITNSKARLDELRKCFFM